MKKIATIVAAVATIMSCTTQPKQQTEYTVTAQIEGLEDSTVVVLMPMSHDRDSALGEAVVIGGKAEFKGTTADTIVAAILVKDAYGAARFILDNSTIAIKGSVTKDKAWDGVDLYTWETTVEGSPLTDEFKRHMQVRDELDSLYDAKEKRFADTHAKLNSLKGKEADAFRKSADYKAMLKADSAFFATVDQKFDSLLDANKETFWGPLLAVANYNYFTPDQIPLYERFSDAAKQSYYGRKMKAELFPGGSAGDEAKQLNVRDDEGKEYTLRQLSEGKKVVLVDFWASWCGPCRKEIPNVKAQYAKYKDKGFQVISISTDKDEAAWRKALAEEKLEWPNFRDVMGAADLYNVRAIPAMYLIDAETQTLIASGDQARGEALATKLAELFQ